MIISNHQNNKIFIVITTSLVIGGWALPVYAYLDPGTGSMLIQGIIGAVAAVGVALKLYWHKLKILFSGRKAEDDATKNSQNSVTKD